MNKIFPFLGFNVVVLLHIEGLSRSVSTMLRKTINKYTRKYYLSASFAEAI